MSNKKKAAFICVHNSCRSQIAETLGKYLAGDKFDFYSAGTETTGRKYKRRPEKVVGNGCILNKNREKSSVRKTKVKM